MEIRKHEVEVNDLEKTDLVFDIETTGFSPDYCTISSISYMFYEENKFIIKHPIEIHIIQIKPFKSG